MRDRGGGGLEEGKRGAAGEGKEKEMRRMDAKEKQGAEQLERRPGSQAGEGRPG